MANVQESETPSGDNDSDELRGGNGVGVGEEVDDLRRSASRSRAVFLAAAIGLLALGAILAITLFLSHGFDSFAKKAARMMSPDPEEGAPQAPPGKAVDPNLKKAAPRPPGL
jgi:hypothetical protein